jgi:hypothetical protein
VHDHAGCAEARCDHDYVLHVRMFSHSAEDTGGVPDPDQGSMIDHTHYTIAQHCLAGADSTRHFYSIFTTVLPSYIQHCILSSYDHNCCTFISHPWHGAHGVCKMSMTTPKSTLLHARDPTSSILSIDDSTHDFFGLPSNLQLILTWSSNTPRRWCTDCPYTAVYAQRAY